MSTIRTSNLFVGTLTLLLTTLACNAATHMIEPNSPSTTQNSNNIACTANLASILEAATTIESYQIPQEESKLVTYSVYGNELRDPQYEVVPADLQEEQADVASQKAVWDYFTAIIPEKKREFLTEYSVLTDGKGNLLSAVSQSSTDPTHWRLEVDIADSQDYDNLTFTLIHEFGHLLTLNAEQVTPTGAGFNNPLIQSGDDQEAISCPNYFSHEGCSNNDSYINQFYQRFWSDKANEWSTVETTNDEYLYYVRLNEFYEKYQDQFVTSYAATNPGEDIAESWAYFILSPKPQGSTIAEQKILFFYENPELVELRLEILTNLCNSLPE
jgi:hypothetical protein